MTSCGAGGVATLTAAAAASQYSVISVYGLIAAQL